MAFVVLRSGTFILVAVGLCLLTLCPSQGYIESGETSRHELLNRQVDLTQAEMMLSLLRSSVDGNIGPPMIESVLDAHGTALIIRQQNISRAITRDLQNGLVILEPRGTARPRAHRSEREGATWPRRVA
jgi:hypothetical protein